VIILLLKNVRQVSFTPFRVQNAELGPVLTFDALCGGYSVIQETLTQTYGGDYQTWVL